MTQPLGVMENIETVPKHRLFTLAGVTWVATPTAWFSIPLFLIPGVLLALLTLPGMPLGQRFLIGLGYGTLVILTTTLHSIGHMMGGLAVNAPMLANLVTATRHVNLYQDHKPLPPRVHLARALGGPVMNICVGVLALLANAVFPALLFSFLGWVNLLFGLGSLLPIPSVDGEVIWRELGRLRSRQ